MLSKKDIQNLSEVFATKQDLKDGLDGLKDEIRHSFSDLQGSVDRLANGVDKYHQEMKMLSQKVDRHEKWIQQLAKKLGVKLEY